MSQCIGHTGMGIGFGQLFANGRQDLLDRLEPLLHCQIGFFQRREAALHPRQRILLRAAAAPEVGHVLIVRFGLGFDSPQDLLDRAIGECLRFLHLAKMGFQGLRRRLGIGARLDQPQCQLLQIAGERAGLTAGAGGGLAELVGETRQALVQAL